MVFRDIEISMTQQCMFFVYSIVLGAVCGAVYDIFRIFRVALRHNGTAVFFEDVLFCLICCVMLILFIFCANYGIVRWFSFFGWAGGFYIYYMTVGKMVISAANMIIGFIKNYIIYPAKRAVYFVFSALLRFVSGMVRVIKKYIYELRKYLRCRRIVRCAAKGFGIKV
ncbi:MAG: spore cortex biosynthesis protein YabQ [Clostridia bacterium]|nr:spore cortex biosynthesis protein YabQ [Clostridia bacterium]